jgi:hypothetical protein
MVSGTELVGSGIQNTRKAGKMLDGVKTLAPNACILYTMLHSSVIG